MSEETETVIKVTEGTIKSTDKESDIAYRLYESRSPRAVLHIVHGMAEHFGRYDEFARYMARNGVTVIGADLIGHGKTAKDADSLGHFTDWNVLVQDQSLLVALIRKKYRTLPYIMLGHSMGSFIVRVYIQKYIQRYDGDIDGVIIMGTAGRNKQLGLAMSLSGMIARVRGDNYRSKLLKNLTTGAFSKAIPGPTGNEWLSRDNKIAEAYAADELCGFGFTAKAYNEEFKLLKEATQEGWTESIPLSLPILVTSGKEDPVGANGAGPTECYADLDDHECCDIKLKLYDGCRHEILNETNKEEVWADILAWINDVRDGKNEASILSSWPPVGGASGVSDAVSEEEESGIWPPVKRE